MGKSYLKTESFSAKIKINYKWLDCTFFFFQNLRLNKMA